MGNFAVSTFLISLAVGALVTWAAGEIFGHQLVGGIGSAINGGTAIATGISLLSFGPIGWIIGGIAIVAGVVCIAFGTAEIQESFGVGNWIKDGLGITGGLYDGLYVGSNIVASVATIGGNAYRSSRITYGSGRSSTNTNPRAYSRYYQMEGGKVKQITHYGKGGVPKYTIDVFGKSHGNIVTPHKHPFSLNTSPTGITRLTRNDPEKTMKYLLWLILGNWR